VKRAIAIALLIAACKGDDPYAGGAGGNACLDGSYRDPGPGCTVAPLADVTVDGHADEWTDERVRYPFSASCCGNGDPGELFIARTNDGASLAMFMPIIGAALTDVGHNYVVHFRRYGTTYDQPGAISAEVVMSSSQGFMRINGIPVYGIPIEYAFGPDGLELRVPLDALPYPGSAYVDARLVKAIGGQVIDEALFTSQLCWNTADPDGPCTFF